MPLDSTQCTFRWKKYYQNSSSKRFSWGACNLCLFAKTFRNIFFSRRYAFIFWWLNYSVVFSAEIMKPLGSNLRLLNLAMTQPDNEELSRNAVIIEGSNFLQHPSTPSSTHDITVSSQTHTDKLMHDIMHCNCPCNNIKNAWTNLQRFWISKHASSLQMTICRDCILKVENWRTCSYLYAGMDVSITTET